MPLVAGKAVALAVDKSESVTGFNAVGSMKKYINFTLGCVYSTARSIERYGDEISAAG